MVNEHVNIIRNRLAEAADESTKENIGVTSKTLLKESSELLPENERYLLCK
jgi:hypothetical protein